MIIIMIMIIIIMLLILTLIIDNLTNDRINRQILGRGRANCGPWRSSPTASYSEGGMIRFGDPHRAQTSQLELFELILLLKLDRVPCRAIRGNSISVNSTLHPSQVLVDPSRKSPKQGGPNPREPWIALGAANISLSLYISLNIYVCVYIYIYIYIRKPP